MRIYIFIYQTDFTDARIFAFQKQQQQQQQRKLKL